MLTVPSARGTALNLVSRRLPRLVAGKGMPSGERVNENRKLMTVIDFQTMLGHDVGLMIRAYAAALEDDNILVRRNALDLILQVLRLDGVAIQRASNEDRAIIMRAATSVVMRRDLSLNRRLYTWLLGADENAEQQIAYLRAHSLGLLQTTLRVGVLVSISTPCLFHISRPKCPLRPRSTLNLDLSKFSFPC